MNIVLVIVAIVTLAIGMLVHVVTTVWWASRITTVLERCQADITTLLADSKAISNIYVKKEDYNRDLTNLESKVDAAWSAIDELNKDES
jgi:hypothetical protein